MSGTGEREESFWDLLNEISRLQAAMGQDMVAWARVYENAGKALQRNAETAALMAHVGRRSERFLRNGPTMAVRQAMNLFFNPLGALGAGSAGGPAGPLARFWETWAAAMPSSNQPGAKEPPQGESG
jgi:hypothetical protein